MATQQLYYWRSDLTREYGYGWLIASGATPDEAREKIKASFESWFSARYFYSVDDDPDDIEEKKTKHLLLDKDLAAEPTIVDGALYISGSE